MGRRKVVPNVVSILSFAFLLSSSLQVGSNLPAFCAGKKPKAGSGSQAAPAPKEDNAPDSAPQAIGTLEQRLFFKKFREDALDKRVARIETRVYGEAINGPIDDRITRLSEMLQSQLAEEAKKKQAEAERQAQEAEREKQAAANSKKQQQSNSNDAIDRAKLDIQAAKEEEVEKLIAAGTELYRGKRGQEAISKFEEALRLDPTNPNAHFSLGIIYEAMGNFAEALSSYQQASKAEPGNPEYKDAVTSVEAKANSKQNLMGLSAELRKLAETANANWKAGDYIGALNMYMEVDQKEPNKALVKYNIGSIYLMMKDQMNALEYYKQAARLEPSNPRFAKAYNDLNTEYRKSVKAQDQQEQQQLKDYKAANAPPTQRKDKKVQKLPGQTQKLSPQQQQFANQMAAQMKQVPRSMPGQQPMQQQMQMPQQQQQWPQQQMPMPQQQQQWPQQQMQMPQQQQQWPQQQMQMPQQQQQWPQQQMQMPQQQQQWPQQQVQMPQQQQQWPQQQMQMPPQQQWPQQQMQMPPQQQWPQQQMQQPQMQPPRTQMPMPKMPTGNPSGIQPAGRSPYGLASNTVNQMTQQTPGAIMNPTQAPAQQDSMSTFGLIGRGNGQGVTVTNVGIASRAASAGIIPGDDIRAVDGIQVTQPNEINNILQQKMNTQQRVPVMIMRGGNLAVVNL